MTLNLRTARLGMTLVLAATCLGCGGADEAPSRAPPSAQPGGARRVDARAIDQAIAAVERGESAEILLPGIQVTGADLRRIGRLKMLHKLNLGTQPLDLGDDLLALRDLAGLQELVLGAAPITDRGLAAVRGMRELNRLNVTGTRVTDDGLVVLVELPKLEKLRIGGPAITDAGVARLKTMKQLKELILWDCPLTDGSLPHLLEMTHLRTLYLYGTGISEEGLSNLSAALKPYKVHLHY